MSNDDLRRDFEEYSDFDACAGDANPEALASIEEAIRAASTYVVPSDDLRPRTLEAARELCEERRSGVRVGRFAAVLLVCMLASLPIAERLSAWYERAAAPSSAEVQERALRYASDRNIGPHWGLYEAFSQIRRSKAARLGQADALRAMQ